MALPADESGRRDVLSELFLTKLGVLLLLMVLIGVSFLFWANEIDAGSWKNFLFALGTALFSSAVLTTAQQFITMRASQDALSDRLATQNAATLRTLVEETRRENREFFPSHIFPSVDKPDPALNHTLMEDLARSRQFMFRAFSGRHTAVRLLAGDASGWEVRTVIADPADPAALAARAQHALLQEGARKSTQEQIHARLVKDIEVGLVGLYLARTKCDSIQIYATPNPTIDRFELFDDSIWLTLFSTVKGKAAIYPRTLRFTTASYVYEMERREFVRVCHSPNNKQATLRPGTTEREFLAIFEMLTGRAIDQDELETLIGEFETFKERFSGLANLAVR